MKRIYFKPELQVIKLDYSNSILSGSAYGTDIRGNANPDNEVLGRYSDWDEDE